MTAFVNFVTCNHTDQTSSTLGPAMPLTALDDYNADPVAPRHSDPALDWDLLMEIASREKSETSETKRLTVPTIDTVANHRSYRIPL